MLVRTAEESFDRGMQSMEQGRQDQALAFFEAAISLDKQYGSGTPQARYLSQYGLCLGLLGRRKQEGVRFCRQAVALEGYNADLQWNLGRSLLMANRRREAWAAFAKGLRLQRDHRGIIQSLRGMGIRRRPALPFLPRENPINVFLGRLLGSSS